MRIVFDKDRKGIQEWLRFNTMGPHSKRDMLFVAEQLRRDLTPKMAKFFDSLIHEGREHEAPSKEQLVSFHSIIDELKQKLRR
jgi:hypothetical protein